jgi:uncharacterized protein
MSLTSLAERRPIGAATACAVVQFGLTALILIGGTNWLPRESFGAVKLTAFASTVVLPLILAQLFGVWRQLGFGRVQPDRVFLASLAPAALLLVAGLHAGSNMGGGSAPLEFGMQFVNAFAEELLFRGVIFALLWRVPVSKGLLLQGVLFGAMHLLHGFMDGNWAEALAQMGMTAVAGMLFAAVRYASGSLWLAIACHMIANLAMIYSNIEPRWGADALEATVRLMTLLQASVAVWVAGRAVAAHTRN